MILQGFDLVQTLALLHHGGKTLDLSAGHLQHVVETIQHNLDNLGVLAVQQVAKGWNNPFLDQVRNLGFIPRNGEVRNCPGSLLLRLKFSP